LRRRWKGGAADRQRIAFQITVGESLRELPQPQGIIPKMHRDGDLGFQLSEDLLRGGRIHGESPADRGERHVDFANLFDLVVRQRMGEVPQMDDAERSQIENEGGSFEGASIDAVLIDGNVVDENIPDIHADAVPIGAEVAEASQDDRTALHDLHKIMVEVLPADRYYVAQDRREGIPTRSERVGDDSRSFSTDDLKEIMAEILNGGVDLRGERNRRPTRSHIHVAAGCREERGVE